MRIKIEYERSDGTTQVSEHQIADIRDIAPHGEDNLIIELEAELRKAVAHGTYMGALPAIPDLSRSSRGPRPIERIFNIENTQSLWLEIENALLDIRYLLAEAKAYKDLEPAADLQDRDSKQLRFYAHFEKMHRFNLAVFEIKKIQDLVVRLVFENFEGDLITVNRQKDEWERSLTLWALQEGLKKRLELATLSQQEYALIDAALGRTADCPTKDLVIRYRNRLTHRLRPSVDYPELFTHLQDRVGTATYDSAGKVVRRTYMFAAQPEKAEFQFNELYPATVTFLTYVIEGLTMLKQIPRFS